KTVANIETLNDDKEPGISHGLGVFEITPDAGTTYELKIDTPTGIESKHTLPKAKAEGVVLSIPTGVTNADESINVVVTSLDKSRNLLVGAYCRGRLLAHWRGEAQQGKTTEIKLDPDSPIGGVYRVTVFEERARDEKQHDLIPVAERLVCRRPAGQLQINIQPDKQFYVPGDKATLTATTRDEKGQPVPGILMLAVVDKSVITLADEKTFRSMPTHFLVTSEVRRPEDLEHADVLLGSHPKAAQALDLLLGTQG